jgi:hypothetical protein
MNKVKYALLIAIIIPLINSAVAFSQGPEYRFNLSELFPLHDFTVSNTNGLSIDAIDKDGNIDENISGIYTFVINGYIEKLNFEKGSARISSNFNSSEVFYVKHERQLNTLRHLYYTAGSFTIRIPLWLFILVPVLIILLAIFIKRILFFLLFVGFVLFFITQGLDFASFINLVKESFQYFNFNI